MKKKNVIEIDEDIRKVFGKFYLFSVVIIIFLSIFPFIYKYLNGIFSLVLLLFILVFYIYMVIDLFKKKNKFWSAFTSLLILVVTLIYSLDTIKLVMFLLK